MISYFRHLVIAFALVSVSSFSYGLESASYAATGKSFVHLVEWRWDDVAKECKHFLGPIGYQAVQVSPPQRSVDENSWWSRYQPISYEIEGRSGNREQFAEMIKVCREAGVDVYVDAVINHMAAWDHFYLDVPYSEKHFHMCQEPMDAGDKWSVRNCDLFGFNDLKTESPYVQDTISAYLNDLLALGVAGFRIDAAKHIPPEDLRKIIARLDVTSDGTPPFIFLDVRSDNVISSDEYTALAPVTEYKLSSFLSSHFKGQTPLKNLQKTGSISGWTDTERAVTFPANHINQRMERQATLNYGDGEARNNLANVFAMAWPYGYPKIVSGFYWTDPNAGPPEHAAYDCFLEWRCEHLRLTSRNMVEFRKIVAGEGVKNWWDNGYNQIAFSIGDKGFVAFNADLGGVLDRKIQTGLPAGIYCDVLSGDFSDGRCEGQSVEVDGKGYAKLTLQAEEAMAIHVKAVVAQSATFVSSASEESKMPKSQVLFANSTIPKTSGCRYPTMFIRASVNDWKAEPMHCIEGVWQVRMKVSGGGELHSVLFDLYGDSRIVWGDNNLDAYADRSGSKIPVLESGEYLVSLDEQSLAYRLTQTSIVSETHVALKVYCDNARLSPGQAVYVVGDSAALGNWNASKAIELSPLSFTLWGAKIAVPKDQVLTWKCIKRDMMMPMAEVDWQRGSANIVYTSGPGEVYATF